LIELTQDFDVHPNQIKQWRDQLRAGASGAIGQAPKADTELLIDKKTPHAKITELTLENNFCSARSCKENTSKPAWGHKIYPYLLRNLPITRPNQVWAMDITLAAVKQATWTGFCSSSTDSLRVK